MPFVFGSVGIGGAPKGTTAPAGVTVSTIDANHNAMDVNVKGGTVAVTIGSAVTANQGTAGVSRWLVDGSGVTQPVSGSVTVSGTVTASGPLTDTQLRATPVPVSGSFYQATQPVSGTFWQATQPVSGTVAVTNSGIPTTLGQTTASASMPVVAPSNNPLPTSGGCSIYRVLSVANSTGVNIKNAAGQVYGIVATNVNAAARFLKLYNKATAPTTGSDTPVMTFVIPGNTVGAGIVIPLPMGIAFGTGIGQAITTAVGDSDTGAPAANEVVTHVLYV